MAEHQLPKLRVRVRFPLPAPEIQFSLYLQGKIAHRLSFTALFTALNFRKVCLPWQAFFHKKKAGFTLPHRKETTIDFPIVNLLSAFRYLPLWFRALLSVSRNCYVPLPLSAVWLSDRSTLITVKNVRFTVCWRDRLNA